MSPRLALPAPLQRQVVDELRRRTPRRGMRKRVAHDAGVSEATIADILNGRRAPTLTVAIGLGLVKVVMPADAEAQG